mmetsp:Transcript_14975/g.42434  ORF Transcript_14975/g.42434 Transcript_14975/m.42434 type:complete len:206 (-) Transcript_14975:17-634(-)
MATFQRCQQISRSVGTSASATARNSLRSRPHTSHGAQRRTARLMSSRFSTLACPKPATSGCERPMPQTCASKSQWAGLKKKRVGLRPSRMPASFGAKSRTSSSSPMSRSQSTRCVACLSSSASCEMPRRCRSPRAASRWPSASWMSSTFCAPRTPTPKQRWCSAWRTAWTRATTSRCGPSTRWSSPCACRTRAATARRCESSAEA